MSPEAEPNTSKLENEELADILPQEPVKEPAPSIWGDHLNKPKPFAVQIQAKPSANSSPSLSYSKLTEKLMKGAKINIRTSLTRKLSSKSLSSPVSKPTCSQNNISQVNEACDSVLSDQSLLCTTTDGSPPPMHNYNKSQQSNDMTPDLKLKATQHQVNHETQESTEVIQGFKPKIIQHQASHKQPFSLSMARQRIANRQVDLEWLDNCLVEGGCSSSVNNKPEIVDDDVIYSTDDDEPKPSKVKCVTEVLDATTPQPVKENVPPPLVKKRKYHDEEETIPETNVKRHKIEPPILQENETTQQSVLFDVDAKEDGKFEGDPDAPEDCGLRHSSKENSSMAAKRERLVK